MQLFKVENKQYLLFSSKDEQLITQQLKDNGVTLLSAPSNFNLPHSIVVTSNNGINDLKWAVAKTSDKFTITNSSILYQGAFYTTEKNGHELGLSQLFYVKLNNANDIDKLSELAKASNVTIIGNDKNVPLLYILHCTKTSEGNALQMANKFYETGKFSFAEPDLFGGIVFE